MKSVKASCVGGIPHILSPFKIFFVMASKVGPIKGEKGVAQKH